MPDQIVINTGPLIAFSKAKILDVICDLPFEFISPVEVQHEIKKGTDLGYTPITPAWLNIVALSAPLDPVYKTILDDGEAAVIQLALERKINYVCIDENKGRRIALAAGLKVVGTLGLLLKAKSCGLLSEIKPVIETLQADGIWYSPDLIERILKAAEE